MEKSFYRLIEWSLISGLSSGALHRREETPLLHQTLLPDIYLQVSRK